MSENPIASRIQSKNYQETRLRAAEAAKQIILIWEALKEKPQRAPELARALGYPPSTVHNRLRRLALTKLIKPLPPVKFNNNWSYPWAVDEKALERALAEGATSKNPTSEASPASPEATTSEEEKQAAQ